MRVIISITLSIILFPHLSTAQNSSEWLSKLDSYKTSNVDSAILCANFLISEAEKGGILLLKNKTWIKLAETHVNFNMYDKADSILNLVSGEVDLIDQVPMLRIRGKILNKSDENDKAIEEFYKALELCKTNHFAELEPEIYFEIAAVLRKNNDLQNCTKYYRFAIEKGREVGNLDLEVRSNIQMCKVYNGWIIVNLDSSIYYGERAVQLSIDKDYEYGYAHSISVVSSPIIRTGQYRRGLEMSKEALKFTEKYNFSLMTQYYLTANLGFAYEGLNMYDSALFFMEKAGELRPESLDYPRLKYRILKAQGMYRDALEALEIYFAKSDSTLRNRNKTTLSNLQARYEANLKEQELHTERELTNLQQVKLDQQRYIIIGAAALILLLTFGIILLYRQRKLIQANAEIDKKLTETKKHLELEKQYRASELKAIRSQMNPHFVFNALNSIQEYIMTNERKLAGKYLGKFADLMRIYLQHSQVKTVTIREEVEALSLYLELEKLRFEDSLTYSIEIEDQVNRELSIPSLLLQPYVENAVKHGLLHKESDRILAIKVSSNPANDLLICEVNDNGIGRKKSHEINKMRNPGHKSFATQATKSRIELLNLDREEPIEEVVQDLIGDDETPLGTKVIIRIPLNMEAQSDTSEVSTQKVNV